MKRILLACAVSFALPVLAEEPTRIITELNGMDIEVEELGVPKADFSADVDVVGVPAVRVTNHSNEIASCQFRALPEETVMTAAPAMSINPEEEVVMRVPGKYSAGGPYAVLTCRPEGKTIPPGNPVEILGPDR